MDHCKLTERRTQSRVLPELRVGSQKNLRNLVWSSCFLMILTRHRLWHCTIPPVVTFYPIFCFVWFRSMMPTLISCNSSATSLTQHYIVKVVTFSFSVHLRHQILWFIVNGIMVKFSTVRFLCQAAAVAQCWLFLPPPHSVVSDFTA